MLLNKIILIGILLISISGASAWGEDTPYSQTNAWLSDIEYCSSSFIVMVANFNHTYPNAFNYTLTYTLQYRDINGNIQDESMSSESYNVTIGDGQYTWLSHIINVNTIMNIITEIEEDTTNPYRFVKIELDYNYCDNGGCVGGSSTDKLVDFTNCNPADDVSYGDTVPATAGTDYGFVSTGRGSDAGSGGVYEGINVYGSNGDGDGGRGTGDAFKTLFYLTIPLLFIICVIRFIFGVI